MELRHLRYFVAVAEAQSLKLAAEEKLNTTQPSLSRQIRDLEQDVGTPLFLRSAKGVTLTPAGRVFLDHARLVLTQADVAVQSARRAALPSKPSFVLGFMIGHDTTWLPAALKLLHGDLPDMHVVISTQNSPQLAIALSQGAIDVAFLRRQDGTDDLDFETLVEESFAVFLRSDHPLAARESISVRELADETFISVSGRALGTSGRQPALRRAVDRFLEENGIAIRSGHEVDHLGGVMSLVVSTGGVALLPLYARSFLPATVTARPLLGDGPKIDLSVGYRRGNLSPILKVFLSRLSSLKSQTPGTPT